jgi:replicative DNA helicase
MNEDVTLERTLPNNLESERAVLGAILLHPPALFEACECLAKDDFYLQAHRIIFEAYLSLHTSEKPIDPITCKSLLQQTAKLEECGGPAYLMSLTEGMPRAINIRHYASLVHEEAIKRRVIQIGQDAMVRAYDGGESSKEIVDSLQLELIRLTESNKRGGWRKMADLVQEAYSELDALAHRKTEITGLDTGFRDLNLLTQGMQPGQLIIVAGRPGHGKTSLGLNIIATNVLQRKRVGLFTIEMSAREITKRIIYADAEVDGHRVGSGHITADDWKRIGGSASRLTEANLSVDESGSLTIMELRSRAQQLAIGGGLDLVVVDYLQLMAPATGHRGNSNRAQEISDISRGLKALAKDLNIPIIAMSQLNREVEKEGKRKPRLADLRESGSIEQDADVVLFIWREELRDKKDDNEGQAELIIGKQRNGPVGQTVNLTFLKQFTKFVSSTQRTDAPQQSLEDRWLE